jgi:RNA polymerase sigma-70 factor (ECF subfamily)
MTEGPENTTDPDAPDLVGEVYGDLRRIAADYLSRERIGHTLEPTALVHEAYLKIADRKRWKSAAHFRAVASRAMRQILVDHARLRGRQRRGGRRERVMLTTSVAFAMDRDFDVLALDEALIALARHDERKARVVELRFFGIAQKTAESDWYFARAWLHERLDRG